jgi:hypothetical protein
MPDEIAYESCLCPHCRRYHPRRVAADPPGTAYPHPDGDFLVLGPEVFTDPAHNVICWRGQNYYADPPGTVRIRADDLARLYAIAACAITLGTVDIDDDDKAAITRLDAHLRAALQSESWPADPPNTVRIHTDDLAAVLAYLDGDFTVPVDEHATRLRAAIENPS